MRGKRTPKIQEVTVKTISGIKTNWLEAKNGFRNHV
jgi:hypothetical protein